MSADLILNTAVSMTSREIAELTGKRHDNVLRDIDNLLETLPSELSSGFKSGTYESGNPPRPYRQFVLDRDSTYCLVAGYDAASRMRIIKRWQELEARVALPPTNQGYMLPEQKALAIMTADIQIGALLQVPLHIAQSEAVKAVRRATGLDYQPLLAFAPAQNAIKDDEVMLEPKELAKRLGFQSAAALNRWLADQGLQVRMVDKTWTPTKAGKPVSLRHAWTVGNKSGYNLKWNADAIAALMMEQSA
jgi:phage regulator Rha-like protein